MAPPRIVARSEASPYPSAEGGGVVPSVAADDGEIELRVLDERRAELLGRLDPIGVDGQNDAAGAYPVDTRVIHAGWRLTAIAIALEGAEHAEPRPHHHRVARAEVLLRAVEDR